jgi:hypothetical protein
MTVQFDPVTHRYTVEGRIIPSVTQRITDAGLLGSAAQFYSPESAARGTAIHQACADRDHGLDVSVFAKGEHGGYLTSYIKWCDAIQPIWTSIETPRYSAKHGTAGTADRVGTFADGQPLVLDLKSGGRAGWHSVQLAFYDLLHDDLPPRTRRRIVLYLRANGRMAQSVEFSSPYDYTVALKMCAPSQETPDAHNHTDSADSHADGDDGPPSTSGD